MKTLLFTVKKNLHDKLANQSKELKMWRPDFFARCIEIGSEVIQQRLDKEFQHDLTCELANEILLHVDVIEEDQPFDINFRFKNLTVFAVGSILFDIIETFPQTHDSEAETMLSAVYCELTDLVGVDKDENEKKLNVDIDELNDTIKKFV